MLATRTLRWPPRNQRTAEKGVAEGAVERRRKKLVSKSSWFEGSPKQKTRVENTGKRRTGAGDTGDKPLTPVTVLFVP